MNSGWRISRHNFTEDDGSFPTIELSELEPSSVSLITEYFIASSKLLNKKATLWDTKNKKEVLLSEVKNPANLVFLGEVDPFHCCFSELIWKEVKLPVLGLYIFRDSVEIDYAPGKNWCPNTVDAFFGLLAYFVSQAPEAVVRSAEDESLPFPDKFDKALDCYAPIRKKIRIKPNI